MNKQYEEFMTRISRILFARPELSHYVLAGGTALAKFHLRHRDSYDLDLFVPEKRWVRADLDKTLRAIKRDIAKPAEIIRDKVILPGANMSMLTIRIPTGLDPESDSHHAWDFLKVDFVQDPYAPWNPETSDSDGFAWRHLSRGDIYFRKVMISMEADPARPESSIGADLPRGRRTERDVIDLAYLSKAEPSLSHYVASLYRGGHISSEQIERSLTWWRSFPRAELMSRLLDFPLPEGSMKAGEIFRIVEHEFDRIQTFVLDEMSSGRTR